MAVDEAQYRDIATPEDIDWLLSTLVPGTKHMAVFNNMGPGIAVPDMVANLRGDESDKARITEWLSIPNVRLFAQLDVRTLYISPGDIVFMRTKLPIQLKQQEVKIQQLEEYRIRYEEGAKTARQVADDLRAKMEENQRGPSVNDIRDQLLSWPQVFDFKVGPCWDSMSRTVIPANTMVVSFIPVLYDGDDMPNVGAATPEQGGGHRWAPTNPIRLILNEAGALTAFTGTAATLHPHILGDRVCQGNLTRLLSVMLRENNVTGAADCLRQYSISHHEQDWMDRTFAGRSWAWWNKHVVQGEEAWRLGSWDGKSVSVATDNTPIVNIEEFLGGPLEDIIHVGTAKKYVTPTMIKNYLVHKTGLQPVKGYCRMSGHSLLACECHTHWCSSSMKADFLCTATPIDNFVPVPREYTSVNGSKVRYITEEEASRDYICEFLRPNGNYCAKLAQMSRLAGTAPRWMCEAHLPEDVKTAIKERVKSLSELAMRGGVNVGGMLRHFHDHGHPDRRGDQPYLHSHNHEHPKEHTADTQINVHEANHTAFRGAHTGTSTIRHRRYMN